MNFAQAAAALKGVELDRKEEEIFMKRDQSFIVVDFDAGIFFNFNFSIFYFFSPPEKKEKRKRAELDRKEEGIFMKHALLG